MIKFVVLLFVCAYAAEAMPDCFCTREMNPQCGSDGITYSNSCAVKCENSKRPADQQIHAIPGPCPDIVKREVERKCGCTYEYNPVCGDDGQTYATACALDCYNEEHDLDIKIKRREPC